MSRELGRWLFPAEHGTALDVVYRAITAKYADAHPETCELFSRVTSDLWRPECQDPRDRIYAILKLIAWPADKAAIMPDYQKSAVALAYECMDYGKPRFRDLQLLVDALHITSSDVRDATAEDPSTIDQPRLSVWLPCKYLARIGLDRHGSFNIPTTGDLHLTFEDLPRGGVLFRRGEDWGLGGDLVPIFKRRIVKAFANCDVSPNDILVNYNDSGKALVLRQDKTGSCTLLGPASWFEPSVHGTDPDDRPCQNFNCDAFSHSLNHNVKLTKTEVLWLCDLHDNTDAREVLRSMANGPSLWGHAVGNALTHQRTAGRQMEMPATLFQYVGAKQFYVVP